MTGDRSDSAADVRRVLYAIGSPHSSFQRAILGHRNEVVGAVADDWRNRTEKLWATLGL
jgi:hypothetical protein